MKTKMMQYNVCEVCGAKDGRAGLLIGNKEKALPFACMNCHDTITKREITIHANLIRNKEELEKTFQILKK